MINSASFDQCFVLHCDHEQILGTLVYAAMSNKIVIEILVSFIDYDLPDKTIVIMMIFAGSVCIFPKEFIQHGTIQAIC